MLKKLETIGIEGKVNKWIAEWLNCRKQRVVLNGAVSDWVDITSGVPQGSVLGPILFTIYINDLDNGIASKILKFADDTKMLAKVGCDREIQQLREDLSKLVKWSEDWQMKFNVDKCKVMNFGSKNSDAKYVMNDKILGSVSEEKDLGIIVCNNLKVSKQCVTASKKANQILGMIGRTFSCKNKSIILKLYKSLVRPHLDYCSQVWRPHLVKDKECLEKVQRRATRMIEECKGLNYEDRLKLTRLTTLETRRLRADMIEVYRILKSIDKVDPVKFFSRNLSDNLRGHSFKFKKKGLS